MKDFFDFNELTHIGISVFAISLAFSFSFAGVSSALNSFPEFIFFFFTSMVTIGSGFILHEMGHKLLAIYYGSRARFIMWTQGIVFMFVTSLLGFLFAAPGAVYIYNENIKPKQNAAISLIGPGINLIIAVFFIFLSIIAPISLHFSFLKHNLPGFGIRNGLVFVWEFGAALNLMLALFNMIPATPLDGSKVFRYSKLIWFGAILILLAAAYVVIGIEAVISWSIMLALAVVLSKLAFG